MKKYMYRLMCLLLAAIMATGMLPGKAYAAEDYKMAAYDAYYNYLYEEVAGLGTEPVRDEAYYQMFTDKLQRPAITESILAVYLLDVTNDGLEELIIKRYVTHESSAIIDSSDCEWICIYSYVNGALKRIGQSLDWIQKASGNSWSYYEPEGFIGAIISSHDYSYISDDVLYYCIGADGRVYLCDDDPMSVWDNSVSFYGFNGSVMGKSVRLHTGFIPDWQIGPWESDYGRYYYEINGETTTEAVFMATRDSYIAGGYSPLVNNNYADTMYYLSSQLEGYYRPSSWAEAEVEAAIAKGYVPEYLQKNYTAPITRAEFCALATLYYEDAAGKEIETRMQFVDTADVNVQKMGGLGIVNGVGNGAFAPNNLLTRQEAATILGRLAASLGMDLPMGGSEFADGGAIASWAHDAVQSISAAGIMNGVGNNQFDPLGSYTREQAIMTVLRMSLRSPGEIMPEPEPVIGLENFRKQHTYRYNFTDLPEDWSKESIIAAYEYGLVNGSDGKFNPNGSIKLSETLVIACRLHEIYHGGDGIIGVSGQPWYQIYVDYAIANGIIDAGTYSDYEAVATRAQFAQILSKAFPATALEAINSVQKGEIPDVAGTELYGEAVYLLYNAGVLTGSDGGRFCPADSIRRSEVAAIVTRMADPALRRTVEL